MQLGAVLQWKWLYASSWDMSVSTACWRRLSPHSVSGGLLSLDFSLGCFLLSFLHIIRRDDEQPKDGHGL